MVGVYFLAKATYRSPPSSANDNSYNNSTAIVHQPHYNLALKSANQTKSTNPKVGFLKNRKYNFKAHSFQKQPRKRQKHSDPR